MPDASTLAVFCLASLALIAVPGPAVLYIVTRSLGHGRRAGLVSMLGIEAGAFLAFLPQFIDPERGAVGLQAAVLGLAFVAVAILSDSVYVFAAGSVGAWFRARRRPRQWLARLSGGVYIALGASAALTGRPVGDA